MPGGIANAKILFLLVATLVRWSSGDYRRLNLVQHDICKRRFALLDSLLPQKDTFRLEPESSVILEQTWNSSSFKRHSDCKFYLEAPPNMGLYLIIRKLQLRRDVRGNCVDFVEVKQSNDKKTVFCFTPDDVPRSFTDNRGRVRVSITLNSHTPLPKISDTLDVQIIATVKRNCNAERVKPCEIGDDRSCISEQFFFDHIVNCPSCADEYGCTPVTSKVEPLNPSNVVLSAIVSLFLTMTAFGCCIWCLYRQCTRFNVSRNNPDRLTGLHSVPNVNMELHTSSNDVRPSAPPIEQKDLPPSYDSLFPEDEQPTAPSGPPPDSTTTN